MNAEDFKHQIELRIHGMLPKLENSKLEEMNNGVSVSPKGEMMHVKINGKEMHVPKVLLENASNHDKLINYLILSSMINIK